MIFCQTSECPYFSQIIGAFEKKVLVFWTLISTIYNTILKYDTILKPVKNLKRENEADGVTFIIVFKHLSRCCSE